MGNAGSRWVEIDAVLARERLDLRILRQIFGRSILDVVIDREYWLCRIGNRCGADLFEFRNHRAGVVMRHYVARANRNEIAAAHLCSRSKSIRMTRRNLFDEREAHISYSALISFRGVVGQARRLPVSETQASDALALQFIKDCIHHFFAARLPRSFAISKSTKSA